MIFIAIILSLIGIGILTVIGLVIAMVGDQIDNKKIDKYMSSYGFKKEIDHIYHLNNGEKYFYKFARQYYDDRGNIAIQELQTEKLYKMGYREVKKKFTFVPKGS